MSSEPVVEEYHLGSRLFTGNYPAFQGTSPEFMKDALIFVGASGIAVFPNTPRNLLFAHYLIYKCLPEYLS